MNLKESISELIDRAKTFGLSLIDAENSVEMLKYHEYDMSINIILTQLYEYDIKVDRDFYNLTLDILNKIKIDINYYNYLEEIIM